MRTPPKILNYKNFDFEKIDYYQPQKTKKNALLTISTYRLTQNNQIPIYLETPRLKTTTGIINSNNEFYIELELNIDNNISDFFDFLSKIDERNVINCHLNSNNWFNKTIPFATIEEFYKSPIHVNNEKNPTFKLRIPTYNNKLLLEVFNEQKKQININSIEPTDELIAIIYPWFDMADDKKF